MEAKTRDGLVEDEQGAMLVTQLAQAGQKFGGGPGDVHRLQDHGGKLPGMGLELRSQ
ncbi:hypothetical protein D3C77_713800 [compost metagenome]|jgi:hypothetical protein